MAQRVVVAVLFTDLVGSTELAQRVGEDASQELWRTHLALLREAVVSNRGEEVKKIGDGLMAVFRSPSDAISCAVAMQQSVDRQNRRTSDPLGLRVGVQLGEVTPDEGDYYGTSVVIAERLSKRAGGGQILSTDVMRTVAGTRPGVAYRDLGPVELKGISEPVSAVEVVWEPLAEEGLPLPHGLTSVAASPFVGRERELRELREAYARVVARERHIVFLVGEPGIGKSRLASELAREAHTQGATVLYGRCDEAVTPYQPFVEALRHYVRNASLGELRDAASAEAGELAHLVPELARRLPHLATPVSDEDDESGRLRLFDAVAFLLGRPAQDRPLILILDDLHWADHATIQLLRFLLRVETLPVLILATYRETDLDTSHPLSTLLADLHRLHPFDRLKLTGLDEDDVATAIERRAGHAIGGTGRALAETLCRTTDGNPFFIEQLIGHLIETGTIVRPGGLWRFDVRPNELGVPEGVQELIRRRLARLSDACNALLVTAAVAGAEFDVDVLADVIGVSVDDLLDALDEAIFARLLVEAPETAGSYRFAHTLVRDAIYEELGETRRVRLHARIAEAMEASGADAGPVLGQIAHHLVASRPSGSGRTDIARKAVRYAQRAATYAAQVYSHSEAAAAYALALDALSIAGDATNTERCEVLLGLGEAQTLAHMIEEAVDVLEEAVELAREIPDPQLFARVAGAFASAVRTSSRRDTGIEFPVLESALDRLGEQDSPERADVLALFAERLGPFGKDADRARSLVQESLDVATRLHDERRMLWARDVLVMNLQARPASEQWEIVEQNVALAERIGDLNWQVRTRTRVVSNALAVGDVDRADAELAEIVPLAEQTRSPRQVSGTGWWPIVRLVTEGRWEAAELHAEEVRKIGDRYQLPVVAWPVLLFIMRHAQGRLAEIESLIRAAARRSPIAWWRAALALTWCEQGRSDDARTEIEGVLSKGLADVPRDWMWTMLVGLLGLCAHELNDADVAAVAYDHLVPYRDENVHAGGFPFVPAGFVLGLCATVMGRLDTADGHFHTAEALGERSRAWPSLAVTQFEHATMLEMRGATNDRERAVDLVSAALPRLEEFSLTGRLEQARALRDRLCP